MSIANETVEPYSEHKNITCNDECMTDKCSSITKRNWATEKLEMEKKMFQMIKSLSETVNQIRKELNQGNVYNLRKLHNRVRFNEAYKIVK